MLLLSKKKKKKEYEQITRNLSKFVMNLRQEFPRINGFGVGVDTRQLSQRPHEEIPKEEAYKELSFVVLIENELSDEEREKIILCIGKKFFRFLLVGKIEPL